jgi:hypothetical protein
MLRYNVVKIFEPVSLLADTPMWIVARSTLAAKDLKGLRRNAVPSIVAARSNSSAAVARAPAEPTAMGFGEQPPRSPSHLCFFFNCAQKAVVVELELPFLWTPALGIKCAIFRLNPLKALSGFRDGPSNGEIIRLAFDYKPVSPGWEYKVFILWLNY